MVATKPDWAREGRDWPNRHASRFVRAGGLRWHVQVMGAGPPLLLLHGAGAASHSYRDLAPLLARDFTVICPDLPGHGFTETPAANGLSLPGMVRALEALLTALDVSPYAAVAHSAGAAIALRLTLQGRIGAGGVIALNGALRPFPGAAGHIFPTLAKLLVLNPLAIQIFAWRAAMPGAVAKLIEGTGSHIDAAGLKAYGALFATTGHVAGALGMMANWDLQPLLADLDGLRAPLTLIAGEKDLAVPPDVADEVKARVPHARKIALPGLGHLAHEEAPGQIAALAREALARAASIPSAPSEIVTPDPNLPASARRLPRDRAAPPPRSGVPLPIASR
jgi:magnesium chelatase accessory protein